MTAKILSVSLARFMRCCPEEKVFVPARADYYLETIYVSWNDERDGKKDEKDY